MDENIILKYRREFECWVCDECDIENSNTQTSCIVCNAPRTPQSTILRAWSPADEAPPPPPPKRTPPPHSKTVSRPPSGSGPIFRADPSDRYEPAKKSSGGTTAIICLFVLIVIFAILIALSLK